LNAFIILVKHASIKHSLANIPDSLKGRFAGDAIQRLIIGGAVRYGAFSDAKPCLYERISIITGNAISSSLRVVSTCSAVYIATEGY
jgi:hypothetical protein